MRAVRTAAQSHTRLAAGSGTMCAAQYASRRLSTIRAAWQRTSPLPADLHTTLVQDADQRDFSTDAGNSALISITKSPRRAVLIRPAQRAETKTRNSKSDWLTGGNAMSRKKLSRRQFVAATALSSAALITAPYVRGAYAAGKLTMGFWDHWVPGANKASTDLVNEWAAKEKVEVIDRLHHQPGQQEPADHRRRSAGEVRPRHPGDADMVASRQFRTARAGQRHHGAADQAERRGQRHRADISASSTANGSAFPPASAARSRVPARAST